ARSHAGDRHRAHREVDAMHIGNLVKKANSIGDFFAAMPDRDAALADIADHIRKFWEPRMRQRFMTFLDAHPEGGDGEVQLSPIVLEAVTRHGQALRPAPESAAR